jgi:nucleoside triphosphate pyrophosphatase
LCRLPSSRRQTTHPWDPPARLVLASASPRRREILASLGVPFDVVVPDVEEIQEGEPGEVVLENARRKARAGLRAAGPRSFVLGVDTEVVLDGRTLGKPEGLAAARERLEALSGRTHTVLSGVVVLSPAPSGEPAERSGVARSEVTFRDLDPATIEAYLGSGEWRDRAGAYAIQGLGSILAERIVGEFSNVVGLPLALLLELSPELLDIAGDSPPRSDPDPNP